MGDILNIDSDDMSDIVNTSVSSELDILYEELNEEVTLDELQKSIKQLKSGKAAGLDLLLNEFFIHGRDLLAEPLRDLFNCIIKTGHFPTAWSEGLIVPLHKKGDVNSVENYRGITLLSTLGKLFTRVLNNRLTWWAEAYGVYIEAQAGFRPKYSTIDNLFNFDGVISHFLNK